jgi:hypothetical protein
MKIKKDVVNYGICDCAKYFDNFKDTKDVNVCYGYFRTIMFRAMSGMNSYKVKYQYQ